MNTILYYNAHTRVKDSLYPYTRTQGIFFHFGAFVKTRINSNKKISDIGCGMIAGNSRKSRKNRMNELKPTITQENISRHVITHLGAKNVMRGIWKRMDVVKWANGDSDLVEAVMKLAESKKEVANFKRF